jgi:hypothetical protein
LAFSASAGHYPKEWPDIDKDTKSKCLNLSGVYSNSGEEAYTNVDTQIGRSAWLARAIPRYLGQALLPDLLETHNIDPKWATKIELKTEEKGVIEIVLWKENEEIFKTQWYQNIDYKCKRYFITTKGSLNADSHMKTAKGKVKKEISLAKDRTLILHQKYTEKGLGLFFVPYIQSESNWYKYQYLYPSN